MGLKDISLDEEVLRLRELLTGYDFSRAQYIPDFVLFNLAIDIIENSIAVQLLRGSEVPRAAFVNARAAMEAAQDISFLTADSAQYEMRGCMARCAELLETRDIQDRANRANVKLGDTLMTAQDPEAFLHADAEEWESIAPGKGAMLRAAYETVQAKGGHRTHWSGLSRVDLARAMGDGHRGFAEVWDFMYGTMSTHAHPRLRTSQRSVEELPDGGLLFTSKSEDTALANAVAAWSCRAAVECLTRRKSFEFGAT